MITARQILLLVSNQLVIQPNEWEELLSSINADLLLIYRIGLDTPLTYLEDKDDTREV